MGVSAHVWAICGLLLCAELGARHFNGAMAHEVEWDYTSGPNGPANWGRLSPDWAVCSTGKMQSPLAITPDVMVTSKQLEELDIKYSGALVRTNISNNGHAIELDLPDGWVVLKIKDVKYYSRQMHFHYPSEHTILNYTFPLELHMVFQSIAKKYAVIAFMFVTGKDSPFLAQFFDRLPAYVEHSETAYPLPPIKLLPTKGTYGRYMGSLTTPPCTEQVTWTVMLWDFPTVSHRQMQQLKAALRNIPPETMMMPATENNPLYDACIRWLWKIEDWLLQHPNARPTFPSNGRKFYISKF